MLSVAAAHAQPSFELTEPGARSGDIVHFSISGLSSEGRVTYELEIADEDVIEGVATGGDTASGTFAMPDLGAAARTVTVEAEIRDSGKRKKVKRKLEYLGPALPVIYQPGPAAPSPLTVVAPPAPPAPPEPEQIQSHEATGAASTAPAVTPQSDLRSHQSGKARSVEPPRHAKSGRDRRRRAHTGRDGRKRRAATRKSRVKRPLRRTAPPFDHIYVPGTGARPGDEDARSSRSRTAPPAVALAATDRPGEGSGVNPAVLVPTLLGLGGLTLVGTAVLRRRRLTGRPGRD